MSGQGTTSSNRPHGSNTLPSAPPVSARRHRWSSLAVGIVAVAATIIPPGPALAVDERPNVLVIVTDDQRLAGTMVGMPDTLALFDQGGTEFTRPYSATPLCCPARGSIRSGRYAHNHGVQTNWSDQAQQDFDQTTAIESQLQDVGYATALVGKYWNDWPLTQTPPNFDQYAMFTTGYNNSTFNINGSVAQRSGYSTTLLAGYADQFLTGFEANDSQPWYLYITPHAPHSNTTPAAQYANAPVADIPMNPAAAETDRSDKPPWVRNTGSQWSLTQINNTRRQQVRTLMSVDDTIAAVFARLQALGEADNTIAFFTSDNGYMWGEHGMSAKRYPYTDSVQIPFYMRWPGHVAEGVDDPRLVSHVDIAPTIYEAVGVSPSYIPDGVSLFAPGARERLFLEYFRSPDSMTPRTWASIITPTVQYVEWYDDAGIAITFREYYDLVADPWQLVNLLGDANQANNPNVTALSSQLALDRGCAGTSCPQPVGVVEDIQAPSLPGTPVASSNAPGQVSITWAAADDDFSSSLVYRVYRDGEGASFASTSSSSTTTVSFTDTGSAPGTVHTYSVDASDQAGNVGPRTPESEPVTVMAEPPPFIFADSFSSGLAAWSPTAGLTIDNAIGSPAAPSARAQVNNAKGYARKALAASYQEVCLSAALNVSSVSSSSIALLKVMTSGSLSIARIYLNSNRGLRVRNDVTGQVFDPTASLAAGWHRLELCTRVGVSGEIRFYLDGGLEGMWLGNVGTSSIARVQLLDESNKSFTANVDDIVVDQVAG